MGIIDRIRERRHRDDDPIKHVVVLMFENHSFDQMLGCFKGVDGVDPDHLRSNKDSTGREYFQRESNDSVVSPDPKHELNHILSQLKDGNSGFVSEYQSEYPETTVDQRQRIMNYFGDGDLPVLHELAKHFTICDRWYSSVPGPTWTNRFFVHSGTSKGVVTMPERVGDTRYYLHYDQDTIYDRLSDKGISWRVYFGDVPQSLVLVNQRRPRNALHYKLMHRFFTDAQGPERAFPAYSFIEPNYFKGEQNDDHPPHSTMRAQRLLANVYNALRKNEELWNSTLLVVLYDEHGGFYDHVEPPSAVVPDQYQEEYSFDRYGVRVPALLISPWVGAGTNSVQFDHTSLLKYVIERWHLDSLTKRVDQAASIGDAIAVTDRPRTDTPESVSVPPLQATMMAAVVPEGAAPDVTPDELAEPVNDYQESLVLFSRHLEEHELAPVGRPMRMLAAGPFGEEKVAKERVVEFLEQQSLKAGGSGP